MYLPVAVFLAIFMPLVGMIILFLLYVLFLCFGVHLNGDPRDPPHPHLSQQQQPQPPPRKILKKGLSAEDLQKLPKVIGKESVMATDCAVCLDEVEGEQLARLVPGCNHGFHLECADQWLSRNAACPVCRAAVGPETLHANDNNPC